jgi:hypothetical protein
MPHSFCHPERSAAKSKDLLFNTLAKGWESTNPKMRNYPIRELEPNQHAPSAIPLKNSRAAKAALVSPHEKLEERTSKLLHEFIGLFSSVQHAEQLTASI